MRKESLSSILQEEEFFSVLQYINILSLLLSFLNGLFDLQDIYKNDVLSSCLPVIVFCNQDEYQPEFDAFKSIWDHVQNVTHFRRPVIFWRKFEIPNNIFYACVLNAVLWSFGCVFDLKLAKWVMIFRANKAHRLGDAMLLGWKALSWEIVLNSETLTFSLTHLPNTVLHNFRTDWITTNCTFIVWNN